MTRPADLLALAHEQSAAETEAAWRTSVSRAYYACYHEALAFHNALPAPGNLGQSKSVHQQLIDQLLSPAKECSRDQVKLCRFLAGRLFDLRAWRVDADYNLNQRLLRERALNACSKADMVFAAIQTGAPPTSI